MAKSLEMVDIGLFFSILVGAPANCRCSRWDYPIFDGIDRQIFVICWPTTILQGLPMPWLDRGEQGLPTELLFMQNGGR